MNISPREQADILGESLLLSEVGLVDDTAIAIHLTRENALSAKRAELRKRPMESADTGKEIYELNCLHVGSLAAKVAQASLGLKNFNPWKRLPRQLQDPPHQGLLDRWDSPPLRP